MPALIKSRLCTEFGTLARGFRNIFSGNGTTTPPVTRLAFLGRLRLCRFGHMAGSGWTSKAYKFRGRVPLTVVVETAYVTTRLAKISTTSNLSDRSKRSFHCRYALRPGLSCVCGTATSIFDTPGAFRPLGAFHGAPSNCPSHRIPGITGRRRLHLLVKGYLAAQRGFANGFVKIKPRCRSRS
jgi:hypothetical protein